VSEPIPAWVVEFARCAPWIEAALEYDGGTHDIEDVLALVASGECQLWPGAKSAIVTEVVRHPKKTVLHFWLAGGDLQELEVMSREVEEWAREQGCSRATLAGRRGWERSFLRDQGYAPQWAVLAKEL
jgi:hypothetical protein